MTVCQISSQYKEQIIKGVKNFRIVANTRILHLKGEQ